MEIVVKLLFASFRRVLFRCSWTLFETSASVSTPERSPLERASTDGKALSIFKSIIEFLNYLLIAAERYLTSTGSYG